MSVGICQCLLLSVNVCYYLSVSVTICQCLLLSVSVCYYLSVSVSICQCLPVTDGICWYQSVIVGVYWYLLVSVNVYQCLSVSVGVSWCLSVSVGVWPYLSVSDHMCWCLLVSVSVFQCLSVSVSIWPNSGLPWLIVSDTVSAVSVSVCYICHCLSVYSVVYNLTHFDSSFGVGCHEISFEDLEFVTVWASGRHSTGVEHSETRQVGCQTGDQLASPRATLGHQHTVGHLVGRGDNPG